MTLLFIETRVFTRLLARLGLEEGLQHLQQEILSNPDAGDPDPGTGGLRKIRIPDKGRGKGKRGGARVHYLWLPHVSTVYLVFVYSKDEDDTLEPEQKKQLREAVAQIKEATKRDRRSNEDRDV